MNGERRFRRVCVFCGSAAGVRPEYADAARSLADALVDEGLGLIYGGGNVGLMGEVANGVLRRSGEVLGVIPRRLVEMEVAHHEVTELFVVETMHERKARMTSLCDGFLTLPGGIGTMDELFECLTWAQLGYHDKPCGVLNVGGFYDRLLALLDHYVAEGFLAPATRELLVVGDDPASLLRALRARHQRSTFDRDAT